MSFVKEFREFILKGSVVDLAVGVIIGAAFGGVVKSAVDDVMMPPLGYIMGGVDFSDKQIVIVPDVVVDTPAGKVTKPGNIIRYGKFLNTLVGLVIQGFAIFLVIKAMNRLKRPAPAPAPAGPPPPTRDQELLAEIRDLLKKK